MNWTLRKQTAICIVISYLVFSSTACMKTVTEYRTETRPKTVTKYRTVEKEVWEEVEVPFLDTVKKPIYKIVKYPKIKAPNGNARLTVVPFTTESGNDSGGKMAADLVRSVIKSRHGKSVRYHLVNHERLSRSLNKEISQFSREDFKKASDLFNLDYLIAGHLKNWSQDSAALQIEALDLNGMKGLFKEELQGSPADLTKKLKEIFYGKKVLKGVKTNYVDKVKKEKQKVTKKVEIPYQETVYEQESVPYKVKKVDWLSTMLLAVLVAVSAPKSEKDKK